jgi:hypothetical protein
MLQAAAASCSVCSNWRENLTYLATPPFPSLFLQTVEMVDIALPGDPGPLWCAYVPGADAYKLLYSELEAAEGFYLRSKPKWVKHTMADGTVRQVRVYGEIRWGVWWEKADEVVRRRGPQHHTLVVSCILTDSAAVNAAWLPHR